jgi:hypothetical protein
MKEYTQKIEWRKIRLTKADLGQLVALIDDRPTGRQSPLVLTTRLPEMIITEGSLEQFLRHAELPAFLVNLEMEWSAPSGGHKLRLSLGPDINFIVVSSPEQTWMLGKSQQLTRFFQSKRPPRFIPRTANTRIILTAAPSFWKEYSLGLTLLISFLSLFASVIIGILQLLKK